ncbi:MAG TPA: hypothetical protein VK864_20905 [Longimicrobiales bacterium]|nr:hypothetical protein [Longimicrobiales bacterium]
MARSDDRPHGADGILTQVCVECGQEYYYETAPPAEQVCERCGNRVFRSFFDVTQVDDVDQDFEDTTSRDVSTTDPATDVMPGDLTDLNNP